MVARIVCGKSIRGVLNYNENKIKNAEAALLMAAGFPRDMESLSFTSKLERFEQLTLQNQDTKTNALHISLNFSKDDKVDADELKQIAADYMERIGFGGQPFLVYQHFDAPHPHVHIATVNIANGGKRIETHDIGRNQSEKARKEIETVYGLIKAEAQVKEVSYMLEPMSLEKAVYGKMATKAAISSIVREVTGSYKFTSLPELNAVLRQFNVLADRGIEGSKMYEKKGLVYTLLDESGEKTGVPIKASSIYSSPTLKNLEKRFSINENARKPYGLRLKHLIDKAIANCKNIDDLEQQLKGHGIRIILRENVRGEVYGATVIDNATRVVFNGSDLGKTFSAKALIARFPATGPLVQERAKTGLAGSGSENFVTVPHKKENYPAQGQPVIHKLIDITLSTRHAEYVPDPFRKKKKKKGLQNE